MKEGQSAVSAVNGNSEATSDLDALYQQALKLPDALRELLGHRLLVSVYGEDHVGPLWDPRSRDSLEAELRERWEAYKRGETNAVDGDEVMQRLREKYA